MHEVWLTIDCERALYVDRGREIILCDRLAAPVTLVVRMTQEAVSALSRSISSDHQRRADLKARPSTEHERVDLNKPRSVHPIS